MKKNIIDIKIILLFISVWISLIRADNIRIPSLTWEKVNVITNVGEDLPEERKDYAVGYYPDQNEIIIYGGRTFDNRVLSDTWIFNISSGSWRKPALVNSEIDIHPPGRYSMVYGSDQPPSNSYRNTFVITGGKGSDDTIYNDVWSFDFIRECWVELKATGDIPEPRYNAVGGIDLTKFSHLNQLSTVYLIYSHGRNDSKYFTDTYILKLDGRSQQGDYSKLTAEWKKLNTKNAPELKDGVTANVLSNDRLVVFGGCEENKGNCNEKGYLLDVNFDYYRTQVEPEASWSELSNGCIRPKAYAASARGSDESVTDLNENDRLIIFGGITEGKYGKDADGEISIFDMDKRKFFGVQPSSKSNEFPKTSKGAKMIATPKSSSNNGFSIILYGGEPLTKEDSWSTNVWKLDVSNVFSYYPTPPEGVTMTDCYTIQEDINKDDAVFDGSSVKKESVLSLITFILAYLIVVPVLVNTSWALNCFTNKWKITFFVLGSLSLLLIILNLAISSNINNKSTVYIMKYIIIGFLLIFLIFPLIRPKQPAIDFNQGEVNAAGVPVASNGNKILKNKKGYKEGTSSSSLLIENSIKERANTAATDINIDNESTNTANHLKKLVIDQNYRDMDRNETNKSDSYISPIYINPNVKEEAGDDDSDISEVEDEDQVIKKKYLSRANLWLTLLRGIGLLLLVCCITLVLLYTFWNQSRLYNYKIVVYIWLVIVILLYVGSIVFSRMTHSTSALLHVKRISFRPSEPLEPNPVSPSWEVSNDQIKHYSMSETSAYDDIGNVSNYSQSVKNFNHISRPQSVAATNAPDIGGGSSASSISIPPSIPPLPINAVYMNNNGLFSIQSNYNQQTQNQSPTSSLLNPSLDPSIYKASEMTNIPASSSDYPSFKDMNFNVNSNMMPLSNLNQASSSIAPSPLIVTNRVNNERTLPINNSVATFNNPSPESQAQLIPNNISQSSSDNSDNSSPLLEESPIQINTVDQEVSFDFPQRNNTIENMNNKEVMMVMTVPKRKLTVVNL
ncbi:hypothetical protein BCR36DRAFT_581104 [Piromyces finnis]|uniref:Galactose oxidase n=1 Tax=Piromyces finnis TaxID=1754191 RepID=A0A1Y1VHY4_9FUNG|nr:hypothetical protein BCR36DRAFT_581104 [Piromyces finnis]|eukprot:ORX55943.1 hypothetical protein BCR36DRAFT_581104 [Piromyces finnis]